MQSQTLHTSPAMVGSVIFSVLVGLAVLRRAIEPACPGCASKRWGDGAADTLSCTRCGWTMGGSGAADATSQYEMPLK